MPPPMGAAAIRSRISVVPLFSCLSPQELDRLASSSHAASFHRGARVFEEGARADCCYLLLDGRAKVMLNSEDGGEIMVNPVVRGDLVGELALLAGFTRSASLVTTEPCHFIVIPAPAFDVLRKNPGFERHLVADIAAKFRDSTERVRRLTTSPSTRLVAWCLGRIATREGTREGRVIVVPRWRHQELADMAGCSRETATRALRTLKDRKCVAWDGKTMRLDMECLQRFARTELSMGTVSTRDN